MDGSDFLVTTFDDVSSVCNPPAQTEAGAPIGGSLLSLCLPVPGTATLNLPFGGSPSSGNGTLERGSGLASPDSGGAPISVSTAVRDTGVLGKTVGTKGLTCRSRDPQCGLDQLLTAGSEPPWESKQQASPTRLFLKKINLSGFYHLER